MNIKVNSQNFNFLPQKKSYYAWILLVVDILLFVGCIALVSYLRLGTNYLFTISQLKFWFLVTLLPLILYIFGSYELDTRGNGISTNTVVILVRHGVSLVVTLITTTFFSYLLYTPAENLFERGVLLGSLFIFFVLSVLYKILIYKLIKRLKLKSRWLVLIHEENKKYLTKDRNRALFRGKIIFIDPSLTSVEDIKKQIYECCSGIILGLRSSEVSKDLLELLIASRFQGANVMDLSEFYEKNWFKVPIYYLEPEWFLSSQGFDSILRPSSLRIKRMLDIIFSMIIFIPSFPAMVLTSILIKIESRGPIIYSQIREGRNGVKFRIFKFRSMRVDAEKDGAPQWAKKGDNRITRVGKFIRLVRIDELPQLWNVFRGDMSFIGPRPERPKFNRELEKEIPFYSLRHTMQPGITGWAQIMYPYGASVEDSMEKLQYDLYYAKHFNILMDIIIFIKTIRIVLWGRGR